MRKRQNKARGVPVNQPTQFEEQELL